MQQNIALVIVFCLGIVIVAAAIIRAVAITGKAYSDQAALAVWSVVESLMCAFVWLANWRCDPNDNPNSYYRWMPTAIPSYHIYQAKHQPVSLRLFRCYTKFLWPKSFCTWETPFRRGQLDWTFVTIAWSWTYETNLDYRTYAQDVWISGGEILPNNVLHSTSEEALRGDIKMVQEFVSSTLSYIFYYEDLTIVCS